MKGAFREMAISLRRKGESYRDILSKVPVSKSTLSLWLRSVSLAKRQQQRLTNKKREAALRGARSRRVMREEEIGRYVTQGKSQVGFISEREMWLIGSALYWAEGSKQNLRSPSAGVMFGNSDPRMLTFFLQWLRRLGIPETQFNFELYVHEDRRGEQQEFRAWWAEKLGLPIQRINKIYLKKGNPRTNRTNVGDLYHGLLRIKVRMSTRLNRQIHGWIEGMSASLGSGVTGNTSAFGAEDSRIVP